MMEWWLWAGALVAFIAFFKVAILVAVWWMVRNEPRYVDARREQRKFNGEMRRKALHDYINKHQGEK